MSYDIISRIGEVLGDWATSKDAMRWTPEPPEPPAVSAPSTGSRPRFEPGWCRITCGDRVMYEGQFRDLPADLQ